MKQTRLIRSRGLLATGLVTAMIVAVVHVASAGSISVSPALTDDASTGISPAKTYTHTISGGSVGAVNGVNFAVLNDSTTPANFNWNTNGMNKNVIACCNNGDWNPAAGGVTGPGLINLLGSFTYSAMATGVHLRRRSRCRDSPREPRMIPGCTFAFGTRKAVAGRSTSRSLTVPRSMRRGPRRKTAPRWWVCRVTKVPIT